MKLSDGERLIVVMLAEVMEEMKLKREIDPGLVKTLAINNDDWAIALNYPGMFDGESPDDDEVSETIDILWMWGIIEDNLKALTGAAADEAKGFGSTKFDGFDGNNDRHFGIAQTLVHKLGRFSEFAARDLNSHSRASLPRYRAMLKTFRHHLAASDRGELSIAALREICD